MNKLNSFAVQFAAAIKGDNVEVLAQKAWRNAESALKVQIANLEGDVIRKEDAVEEAKEKLNSARINDGKPITNRTNYISALIDAKSSLEDSEYALEAHLKTTNFLKEEYLALGK